MAVCSVVPPQGKPSELREKVLMIYAHSVQRNAHRGQEWFPDAVLRNVEGLVKLIGHDELPPITGG